MTPALATDITMPAANAVLDTRFLVETPESIDLPLHPAGLLPRALAYGIDSSLRMLIFAPAAIIMQLTLGQFGIGLELILFFLVNWLYPVFFEVLNQGCTPGKHRLGLQVVQDDGTPVGWPASMTRNLLRVIDTLPTGYFFGTLSCLIHPQFKRLGDIAAGTLVIYQDHQVHQLQLPEGTAVPTPVPLSLTEQRALLAFAERHQQLSGARRAELAAILAEPLHLSGQPAEQHLDAMARSLWGPR